MPEKNPTVSVIIPTYNRAHLIGRAIKSVLNQTYHDFELIVVDDGSKDNTEEVVKRFKDERIRYTRHDKNKGGGAARNTGIKIARGKFIAFLDSDDQWLPQKLEKQIVMFEKKSEKIGVIYTGLFFVNNVYKKICLWIPQKEGNISKDIIFKNYVGSLSTVIIRRECFEKCGLFDESLPACQDWDIYIRLAKRCHFTFIKEPLVWYCTDNNRITTDLKARVEGHKKILGKYFQDIKKSRKVYSKYLFTIGNFFCHLGQMRKGRLEFLRAIWTYPLELKFYLYFCISFFNPKIYQKLAIYKKKSLNKIKINKNNINDFKFESELIMK